MVQWTGDLQPRCWSRDRIRSTGHPLLVEDHLRSTKTYVLSKHCLIATSTQAICFSSTGKSLTRGTRYHAFFLGAAAAMHLGMVMLCGQIGGFSQAGWTGLLCIGHEKLEDSRGERRDFRSCFLRRVCRVTSCHVARLCLRGFAIGDVSIGLASVMCHMWLEVTVAHWSSTKESLLLDARKVAYCTCVGDVIQEYDWYDLIYSSMYKYIF